MLEEIGAKEGAPGEEDLRNYVINTHGMKSALANIGQAALSDVAKGLEQSGRDGDTGLIASET
ncbi:MAG: hypothetical protein LBB56_08025, partial [Chitinispirillales bacterium]|nr:hypothetical protein [Chitinispirillales bacterium]